MSTTQVIVNIREIPMYSASGGSKPCGIIIIKTVK